MAKRTLERFAEAFNRRDVSALIETVAADAVAQVAGAPFPAEVGRDAIAEVSIPYLLAADLSAEVLEVEGAPGLVLRGAAGKGPIDTAVVIGIRDTSIARLDYVTAPHEPARLHAIGLALSLPTCVDP